MTSATDSPVCAVPSCPDCSGELVFKIVRTTMGTLSGWACVACQIVTQRFGNLDATYDVRPDVVQAVPRPLDYSGRDHVGGE